MRYWILLCAIALVCSIADAQPPQNSRANERRGTQARSTQTIQQSGGFRRQFQSPQSQFGGQQNPGRFSNDQSAVRNIQQQVGGVQIRRSNREEQNATREFTVNALRFDFNGDRQLAANELQNMFVFLASQQNQAIGPYVNGGYRRQLSQRLFGNGGQGRTVQTTTTTMTAPVVQGLAIQRAAQVFLQLILQFDLNNDGMLSQTELMRFAQALLQNDLSLVNASNVARNRVATTASTTTTRNQGFNSNLPRNFITGSIPLNSSGFGQRGQGGRPSRGYQGRGTRNGTAGSGPAGPASQRGGGSPAGAGVPRAAGPGGAAPN